MYYNTFVKTLLSWKGEGMCLIFFIRTHTLYYTSWRLKDGMEDEKMSLYKKQYTKCTK